MAQDGDKIVFESVIPLKRIHQFHEKIKKIQAAAKRLGFSPWIVEEGDPEWRLVTISDKESQRSYDVGIQVVRVSIKGEPPVIHGWRFLAKIEHGEHGNLVKSFTDDIDRSWHFAEPNCDHCHTSRLRNNTYVIRKVDGSDAKQVGGSCLGDFVGEFSRDPEVVMSMYGGLHDAANEFDFDPDRMGGEDCDGVPTRLVVAATIQVVTEDGGYISREKGESLGAFSTADVVKDAFWNKRTKFRLNTDYLTKAEKIIGWLQSQVESDSLWLRNIAVLAGRDFVTVKNVGLLASGYVAWERSLMQKDQDRQSNWLETEEGQKVSGVMLLERVSNFDTQYGTTYIMSFRDDGGNRVVWKTGSPPWDYQLGFRYTVSGTVKSKDLYRDEKQTSLIRVKLLELELLDMNTPIPAFKKLAAAAMPDTPNSSGHTPLCRAVFCHDVERARILLDNGADVNQKNHGIPLIAYSTSVEMAQLFLDRGADSSVLDAGTLKEMPEDVRALFVADEDELIAEALPDSPACAM